MPKIKSLVFMDLETTGLPYYEQNATKITEMSFISMDRQHLIHKQWPRVLDKLSLCLNPQKRISIQAARITGLTNDLLEVSNPISESTVQLLNEFLTHRQKPICLIAHNGDNFDFPILKKELLNVNSNIFDDVYCLDSLNAFRYIVTQPQETKREVLNDTKVYDDFSDDDLDGELLCNLVDYTDEILYSPKKSHRQILNETTPIKKIVVTEKELNNFKARKRLDFNSVSMPKSYKLIDLYEFFTKETPKNSHQAEADVRMLIECCLNCNEKFLNYLDDNAKLFNDVQLLK